MKTVKLVCNKEEKEFPVKQAENMLYIQKEMNLDFKSALEESAKLVNYIPGKTYYLPPKIQEKIIGCFFCFKGGFESAVIEGEKISQLSVRIKTHYLEFCDILFHKKYKKAHQTVVALSGQND